MLNLSRREFGPLTVPGIDAILRTLRVEDITPAYVTGMNDPQVRQFVGVDSGQLDQTAIEAFVNDNWVRPDCLLFGLFVEETHRGNIRLHDYDGTTAWIGLAIFDTTIWGQGFGSAMIAAVSGFCFEHLRCTQVKAGVEVANAGSAAAFAKAGFKSIKQSPSVHLQILDSTTFHQRTRNDSR